MCIGGVAAGQAPPTLESLAGSKVDVKAPIKLPPDNPVPAIIEAGAIPPPKKEWTGGIDLGLNGTDGNSDAFNMRFFTEVKRERADSIFMANMLYNYATATSIVTQNLLLANSRYEWLFANSPWSYWVSGGLQYDQFRAFDLLLFAHTGLGYQWWKNDVSQLKTRFGFGGSYPIGGPDEKFTPEMLLGLD
jgi:putative salt-induced outer membrane protein YdiY